MRVFAFGYLLTVQYSKMTGECCFCFLELETMIDCERNKDKKMIKKIKMYFKGNKTCSH